LLIGAAGMFAELYLAVIFTFLWSFLPDGMIRSAAFIIATTSWIMSLAINLNILMRFDGYYILSDLLEVENLQSRSFALGKWRLRELLFDLGVPAPGGFTSLKRKKLIVYAWSVWVYRFFLFLGIALLVYHFFFKVLGLILFIVEIMWFIVTPVVKEIREWNNMKIQIGESQRYRTVTVICFIALSLFFIPWNTRIVAPAIMEATHKATIHSVSSGLITRIFVEEGDMIKAGQPVLSLSSPSLENEIIKAQRELAVTEIRSQRRASNRDDLANIQVVLQQLEELRSRLNGLEEMEEDLVVRSPIDGTVVDMEKNLHVGRWINSKIRLALIAQLDSITLQGVIEGKKLAQIKINQEADFIPDEPELDTINATVKEIEDANIQALDTLYFASVYGGEVAVRDDKENGLVPEGSIYRIRFEPVNVNEVVPRVVRGQMHIKGEARSFAFRTYDLIAAVLIRESGF
jgi:putative peptide zinc metalloprotease protein